MPQYYDVFVPGGFPEYTYNSRASLRLEARLEEARRNLCKLITVTGHTKSGKTVLVRRMFQPTSSVWVDGGSVESEDDFWSLVIDQLEGAQEVSEGASRTTASSFNAEGSAAANFVIAKGEGKIGAGTTRSRSTDSTSTKRLSSRVAALQALRSSKVPVIIDDFHYLPKRLQGGIVRALKPVVFEGIPVVVIAIPHRRYDAIKVEKEMTGRIGPIDIPVWGNDELRYIPDIGFSMLGVSPPPEIIDDLISEAIGSPHLMQEFCRAIGAFFDGKGAGADAEITSAELERIFATVAESIGRPIFEKLARGPRQRTDRVQRELQDGRNVDIYQLVLEGLAHMKPGLVTLEYEDLRAAIREVSRSQIPQLHEVARVLKHMAEIAATDQSSTPVIDFEETEKRLHITDPFFAFFLRWGEMRL
jgi:hypothetical protein